MKKKEKLKFNLSFKNYLILIKNCYINPYNLAKQLPRDKNTPALIGFFLVNYLVGLALATTIGIIRLDDGIFGGKLLFLISELLFLIPFFLLGFLILTLTIHLPARLLGGSATFKNSLNGVFYSTIALILLPIPILGFLSSILFYFLLTINIQKIHKINQTKSLLVITPPLIFTTVLQVFVGITGTSLMLAFNSLA